MLSLLLLLLSQTQVPEASSLMDRPVRTRDMMRAGGRSGGRGFAFFEFAPASGAGMGTACACAAVTGAKGETLTFTRGSSGTCIKSNNSSSIANGDLVSCGNNLARVMPGFDGTSINGLLVESSRTNVCTQSQAIDNAAFADFIGTGGSAPTLNGANSVPGPWGTTTAEAYTFAATTGAQASMRAFAGATAAAYSCGLFVKGQVGSGTLDLCIETNATGPVATCTACAFTSTAYNWCKVEGVTSVAAGRCFIGNGSAINGGTARSSNAVYVEQMDLQAGAFLGTPIATAGASATRTAESDSFTISSMGPSGSIAATVVFPSANVGAVNFAAFGSSGANNWTLYRTSNTAAGYQINGTVTAPVVSAMGTTSHRSALFDNAGTRGAFWDLGAQTAPATSMGTADTVVWVGHGVAGGIPSGGVVKQVCVDPDWSKCR